MYIQPNSTIEIMRGVPLNTRQIDTLYFDAGETEQSAYFHNFVVYTFTKQYYQRVNKNTCRIEVNAENIYNCNYMRFKNEAFGSKWFYAFITNVEYVNHNVSEVTYEIDVMQTWAFDYVLGACYVEREHTSDDVWGKYLLPEPIDIGDYVCQSSVAGGYNEMAIVLVYLMPPSSPTPSTGRVVEGTFTGCSIMVQPLDHASVIVSEINNIMQQTGGADAISAIYLCPNKFQANATRTTPLEYEEKVLIPQTIGNYVPNNNKLLTYPYTFLNVDCLNDCQSYRFEYFYTDDAYVYFNVVGTILGPPSIVCAPKNYEVNGEVNYTHQVIMGGYPQCSFNVESFNQWLANNSLYTSVGVIGKAATIGIGLATENYMMAAYGAVGLAQAGAEIVTESQRSNTARGNVSNYTNVANGSKDFYFKTMTLKYEKAKAVDEFFSRYGYTCEKVKVPNRNVRKRWTYTKTKGCIVKGNVPADDLEKIGKIFDNGITFWNSSTGTPGEYVMNDNAPV